MNTNNQPYRMTITSGAFEKMRGDFDKVLQNTLRNMEQKDSDYAEISMKLKITLIRSEVSDGSGAYMTREILKPRFDHKVTSVMNIKDEESGFFKEECELVWDRESGTYIAVPLDGGQMSMFADKGGEEDFIEFTDLDGYSELPTAPVLHAPPAPEEAL